MFGRRNEENEKKNSIIRFIDKILMGIVIGGAVGSVLGMTVAPRKGKETRKILKKKGIEALDDISHIASKTSQSVSTAIKDRTKKKEGHWKLTKNEMRDIPNEDRFEEYEEIES